MDGLFKPKEFILTCVCLAILIGTFAVAISQNKMQDNLVNIQRTIDNIKCEPPSELRIHLGVGDIATVTPTSPPCGWHRVVPTPTPNWEKIGRFSPGIYDFTTYPGFVCDRDGICSRVWLSPRLQGKE